MMRIMGMKQSQIFMRWSASNCIREENEDECTSKLFVGDFRITAKDVGSCEDGETYFGSDPK